MRYATDQTIDENKVFAGKRQDVHLCNNYRHLLMSLATIARSGRSAKIIYLEDILPISQEMRARLAAACPTATFVFCRDADQVSAFARLPRQFPSIIRRNLTIGGRWGLIRARGWHMPLIGEQRFETGYIYHAGFFTAKVVAARCNFVVLREDGLSNYARLNVSPFKGLLRALSGLSPWQQIWGEEPWIDKIEVSHPADLPVSVRAKAQKITFADLMDVLPRATSHRISAAFCADIPEIAQVSAKTAILLTQPIDEIGVCTLAEKQKIYADIIERLAAAGYQVLVKPHPREVALDYPNAVTLMSAFPVEAWPYLTDQKFSLGIALCSTALVSGARAFALRTTQLVPPDAFNAERFAEWPAFIGPALALALTDHATS